MEAEQKKRKSGPRTPRGKQRVGRNAIKYGLFAKTPVLPDVEDPKEWERLRQNVLDFFQLEGEFQEELGERVAMLLRRLKRAARMETAEVRDYQADVPADWVASMRMEGIPIPDRKTKRQVEEMRRMMMARLLPGEETMEKILRYESKVHRYLLQTLYMIMILKGYLRPKAGRFYDVAELNSISPSPAHGRGGRGVRELPPAD